jgi:hypothetical protein
LDYRFRPERRLKMQTRRPGLRMASDHVDTRSVHDGYAVHVTEHREGWSITVTRGGRAAPFEVHYCDPEHALATAKAVALTEGADLVVLTAIGRGHELVPAAQVASYVLPIHAALADRSADLAPAELRG